jgi:hypothetical protein
MTVPSIFREQPLVTRTFSTLAMDLEVSLDCAGVWDSQDKTGSVALGEKLILIKQTWLWSPQQSSAEALMSHHPEQGVRSAAREDRCPQGETSSLTQREELQAM